MAGTSPTAGDPTPRLLFVEDDGSGAEVGERIASTCAGRFDVWRVDNVNEAIRFLRYQAPFDEHRRPYVIVTTASAGAGQLVRAVSQQVMLEGVPILVAEVTRHGHVQCWNATVADATDLTDDVEDLVRRALVQATARA